MYGIDYTRGYPLSLDMFLCKPYQLGVLLQICSALLPTLFGTSG